jgi:hypothetical protein
MTCQDNLKIVFGIVVNISFFKGFIFCGIPQNYRLLIISIIMFIQIILSSVFRTDFPNLFILYTIFFIDIHRSPKHVTTIQFYVSKHVTTIQFYVSKHVTTIQCTRLVAASNKVYQLLAHGR